MRANSETTATIEERADQPRGGPRSLIGLIAPDAVESGVDPRVAKLVLISLVTVAIGLVIDLTYLVTGVGGHGMRDFLTGPLVAATTVVCLLPVIARWATAREERTGWMLVLGGIGCYTTASILWNCWLEFLPHPPNPSIADVLWKASYVLIACAITGAGSRDVKRGATLRFWLDAVVAGTATAAITTAFILPPLAHSAGSYAAVRNDFQYPIADSVLLVLALSVVAARGWHLDRRWAMILAAILVMTGADCGWTIEIVNGATTGSSADVLGYLLAFGCIAVAVWQPAQPRRHSSGPQWATLIVPVIFMLVSPTILIFDHFSRVTLTAFMLTMASLAAAVLRLALATRDMVELGDIRHVAMTDELTQLPNRREFNLRLREATAAIAASEEGSVTAMMLDLDNFKQLNDTLGHDAGDELLRMIGPRLQRSTQPGDVLARLGGDEFAILLAPGARPAEAAQAVLDSLAEPFHVAGLALRLTASLGLACFPDDADTPEGLLKCADVAMYDAKRSRRGWEHYASERDQYTRERLELSGALADALETDQIEAVFQPIVDTVTRRIIGTEALARWRQADGSLQGPGEFLDAAELSGLSRPLTRRMLDLALSHASQWRAQGHELFVSVNATVADLLDETFPNEIVAALSLHGVCPDALSIEVTEHSILANPARIGSVLDRLRRVGVKIALDDFGTGYSSLTHLRELPVDMVKIDRSFVGRMCEQKADAAIVYAIIELAHRLDLEVVAEGVEDEPTWQALRELGSEHIQGYACSRPVEPAGFGALLEAQALGHFADSQSVPTPASTASRGSIS